jgi:hypothetical protein
MLSQGFGGWFLIFWVRDVHRLVWRCTFLRWRINWGVLPLRHTHMEFPNRWGTLRWLIHINSNCQACWQEPSVWVPHGSRNFHGVNPLGWDSVNHLVRVNDLWPILQVAWINALVIQRSQSHTWVMNPITGSGGRVLAKAFWSDASDVLLDSCVNSVNMVGQSLCIVYSWRKTLFFNDWSNWWWWLLLSLLLFIIMMFLHVSTIFWYFWYDDDDGSGLLMLMVIHGY